MPIRITGMNSGLDTESIISELVKAKSAKKDDLVKAQTKLQWKQDAWKELNSKVYSLYSKTLSNMRLQSDYLKKTTKVSNSNAASVITGVNAVTGVQTLKIDTLAKSGYLTGKKLEKDKNDQKVTASTKLTDISDAANKTDVIKDGDVISLNIGGKKKDIKITADMTIDGLVKELKDAGLNASFDEKNQRFFVSSKETGAASDFGISGTAAEKLGIFALTKKDREAYEELYKDSSIQYNETNGYSLGDALQTDYNTYFTDGKLPEQYEEFFEANGELNEAGKNNADAQKIKAVLDAKNAVDNLNKNKGVTKVDGQDAVITLNGAEFTSSSNTFEINGLTITANAETDDEFTISTENDTEGIYDMIKNFFKEYNTLINEMDSLYNADSAKGYEPLTDEEKEAMSEKEVEKWEEKIKKSILRKDSTLSSVTSAMKSIMAQGVDMVDSEGNALKGPDGKEYGRLYLSDFGINTLGYFTAKDNEKGAYHIDGDPDDTSTSGNGDKLKTAIANDPDKVVNFFTQLSKSLYEKLGDLMKKTDYSSSFTLYDDVAMKEDYDDYTSKIKSQEQKITAFEDRYYKKFSAMETALAKMSSKESAISGLLGM